MITTRVLSKTAIVLHMYNILINDEKLYIDNFCLEYGIQKLTFHRYLAELRIYFAEDSLSRSILYNRQDEYYYLTVDSSIFKEND